MSNLSDSSHICRESDVGSLNRIINEVNPDEIYNLAAQSHVKISFQIPEYTSDVNALGTLRLLEIIRHYKNKCIKTKGHTP